MEKDEKVKMSPDDYKAKISVEKTKEQEVIWFNYGSIPTTMIPAEKWDRELVTSKRSFVFQAESQAKGRGQNINVWNSPPGNVYLSALIKIDITVASILPLIVSSAILKTIEEFEPKEKANCKWVNDIFIGNKKVGGLLTLCDIIGQ